ncbi:glycerophosphodiester phosphodiesterase family protein [Sulfitobacter delicatus]|uniref:glycerophosphodiester phosphodiesterase n=1 Tax=Sulfitobacter delicatus TaxID=218672 RepID=A0A1G7KN88_9RHOB|nr:glycerophosphodiester phosphodiesterase family protein [Sulfitobacter delicatus]SDF38718.1 glycerophosphoryl diester phosphodiesterase [Sulfitobacter delicatus]
MRTLVSLSALALAPSLAFAESHAAATPIDYGPRPAYLVDKLPDGELKDKLASCIGQEASKSDFSIGHRGAPLMFPEHTVQSNVAAARMGAGILECDVTFTSDHELVCRHAQNDLHTTTNILVSDLAEKCTTGFTGASGDTPASAECRTSDLTLEEFRTLTPKMDSADKTATTVEDYQGGVAAFRTQLYTDKADLMTHAESIELFKSLGAKFTPELKSPSVEMPHEGFSQEDYAQKLVDEYKAAGVPASDVWAQSFNLDDVLYWIKAEPEFGKQAVYLVQWEDGFDEQNPETWAEDFASLKEQGVNYLGASLNMLLTNKDGAMAASDYAKAAKEAGIELIAWTLERSGPLASGGGWYFQSVGDVVKDDSDYLVALDVLAQDAGVVGVFSDWPATTTFYANCMGL